MVSGTHALLTNMGDVYLLPLLHTPFPIAFRLISQP